ARTDPQVQPPPPPRAQPPGYPQERQAQPPPTPGTQPSGPPPSAQQPGQRGAGGPTGQPPRPVAPQQPVGAPAIAPSALQPPIPPTGFPATQAQRAFVPPPAQDHARRRDDVGAPRREVREGDRVMIQEPGRVIIREDGRTIIRHSEVDRFRWQARDVRVERRGADTVTVFERADGSRIYGREEELELLLRRWSRAKTSEGQVVLLSGEAGIGKSRLTVALLERLASEQHTRLRYFCSPQHIDSALYPIIGQMERAAGLARDEITRAKLDKL